MCVVENYSILRNGQKVAFFVEESDARLFVEAPVMYDLLSKAFHILGKNAANDGICREIDKCLSRVDGVPLQSEE